MVLAFTLIACIGFLFAPLGLGGGILYAPVLIYISGWEVDGWLLVTSLLLTLGVATGSGHAHRRANHLHTPSLKIAVQGAVPGAMLGVLIVLLMGDGLDVAFRVLAALVILMALIRMSRDPTEHGSNHHLRPAALRLGAGIGGSLSSILAIGGGAVYVPLLRSAEGVGDRTAVGTSLNLMLIVLPIAIVAHGAVWIYVEGLPSGWALAVPMLGPWAAVLGARMGARVSFTHLSERTIRRLFSVVLVLILSRYAIDLVGQGMGWS